MSITLDCEITMPDKMEKKRARGSSSTAEEDKILEKLSSIQTRIDDGFTQRENELAALKRDFKQDISAVRSELGEVVKLIESASAEISALKKENESLKPQMATTLCKFTALKEEASGLKERVIRQEDYSRRENLRFYNITEDPNESIEQCKSKAKEVITSLGANPNEISVHAIHRVGKQRDNLPSASSNLNEEATNRQSQHHPSRPRLILVRLVSRMDAYAVWERRKDLLKTPAMSSIFNDKDLSSEFAKRHGKLRAALRKAKELNIMRAFNKDNKLFVNSSSYTVDSIPCYLLPNENGNEQGV